MIYTLCVTILSEGLVALGYCARQKKPLRPILIASGLANIVTQSILWIVLTMFFQQYFLSLFAAEVLISLAEALILHWIPWNQLNLREAIVLSLQMNLVSFALGWVLPR